MINQEIFSSIISEQDLHSSPLQIVARRSGKEVPYLIGHKSIGKSCDTSTPGIYTRYGSYYEWLETVTGLDFDEKGTSEGGFLLIV